MIRSDGFAYERFGVTEGLKAIGSFVIGLPEGKFPDFEQHHTPLEWIGVFSKILTPDEQRRLGQELGRTLKPEVYFMAGLRSDYGAIMKTAPTFQSDDGKRFWVERRIG